MEKTLDSQLVQSVTQVVPLLLRLPERRFWVDYDADADALYILPAPAASDGHRDDR